MKLKIVIALMLLATPACTQKDKAIETLENAGHSTSHVFRIRLAHILDLVDPAGVGPCRPGRVAGVLPGEELDAAFLGEAGKDGLVRVGPRRSTRSVQIRTTDERSRRHGHER